MVILVSNLGSKKIRGMESRGMLLCADSPDGYRLLMPDRDCLPGAGVS